MTGGATALTIKPAPEPGPKEVTISQVKAVEPKPETPVEQVATVEVPRSEPVVTPPAPTIKVLFDVSSTDGLAVDPLRPTMVGLPFFTPEKSWKLNYTFDCKTAGGFYMYALGPTAYPMKSFTPVIRNFTVPTTETQEYSLEWGVNSNFHFDVFATDGCTWRVIATQII